MHNSTFMNVTFQTTPVDVWIANTTDSYEVTERWATSGQYESRDTNNNFSSSTSGLFTLNSTLPKFRGSTNHSEALSPLIQTTTPTVWSPMNVTLDNASSETGTEDENHLAPLIGGICLAILTFVMLVGNLMALITIYGSERLRRKPKYLFVANLATADLIWSVFLMPMATAWEITETWIFGGFLCDVYNVVDIGVSTVSTYSLLLISVNQFLNISRPLRYPSMVSGRRIIAVILSVWIIWISFAVVSVFANLYEDTSMDPSTIDDPCLFVMNKPFAIVTAVITFIIPFIILLTFSVRIIIITNEHVRRFSKQTAFRSPNVFTTSASQVNGNNSKSSNNTTHSSPAKRTSLGVPVRRVSWRGIALLLTVVVSFMILSAPYYITTLVNAICDCVDPDIYDNYLVYLYYMNPLVNPYIYVAADSQYRKAMIRRFSRRKSNRDSSVSVSYTTSPKQTLESVINPSVTILSPTNGSVC